MAKKHHRIFLIRRENGASGREGYTLIEMAVVVGIILTLAAIAVPLVQSNSGYFTIHGAGSNVGSAIQSARYQAIFQGCQYQLVFTAADNTLNPVNSSYQLQGEPYSAANNSCAAAFQNICNGNNVNACPIALSGGTKRVSIPANATLTFFPGGRVAGTGGAACPCQVVMTYGNRTATITVSNYGNVNIQYVP